MKIIKMKILIVNTFDISGGAARAAYRLHQSLKSVGVDSYMLVQFKSSNDPHVIQIQNFLYKFRPILDKLPLIFYKNKALFSTAWVPFSTIAEKINSIDADVIHLHWVASGMIRIEDLKKINKPIVWSLHDMWTFTGGCHYNCKCEKYINQCGACPVLGSNKTNDLSYSVFSRKEKTYSNISSLTVVGLSRWLTDCAKNSFVLRNTRVVNIPNPIDVHEFRPFDKGNARNLLNLPLDKKLVLFGGIGAINDPRKGLSEFIAAMKNIESSYINLVILGSEQPLKSVEFSFPTHYIGHLPNDYLLCMLYAAVDTLVVPSLQENLSNSIMECLACGTPVVAFDIGGNNDMIDHKKNGYLAKPYDAKNLAVGIDWVLNHQNSQELSQNARNKVIENFESKMVARRYIELYEEILSNDSK